MKVFSFFLAFLVIIMTIYAALHAAVYFSLVHFFQIVGPQNKQILAVALAVLGLGFIVASVLAHWGDNRVMRAYYFISGAWVGLLVNILLTFVLTWIIVLAGRFLGTNVPVQTLGIIAIGIALAYTAYGAWSARSVKIKQMEIAIPNLPEQWKGKKIVHIADIHLGYVFRDMFFNHVVEKINEQNADIVAITGDLFDGTNIDINWFIDPLNEIKATKGVYYVTGNHETYIGVEKVYEMLEKTNVKVLKDSLVQMDGIQLLGVEYPLQGQSKDIFTTIRHMDGHNDNMPRILLLHEPVQIDRVKQLGVSLQLSGHTHRGQVFPLSFLTKLIYKKYHYGLIQEDDFSLYTTSGVGGWGPPIRTGAAPEIAVITLK